MPFRKAPEGHRVLIVAPFGRDGPNVAKLLASDGYDSVVAETLDDLALRMDEHVGAIVLTEEALLADTAPLRRVLDNQPPWSDIPTILLAARPTKGKRTNDTARSKLGEGATNVVVIERPLSSLSLLSAISTAMRARQKQFEMRDRLHELAINQIALRNGRDLLAAETRALDILNQIGVRIAAELDLDKLVNMVVEAGVELAGAQFGAFFYKVVKEGDERYTLYSLSGASREDFEMFPMPRSTNLFESTFDGVGLVRSDDVTKDERYGKNAPYKGMPEGHLPVRSYLAVPVSSRSGEVLGALFFGHSERAVFDARSERLIAGLAGQAAIGIDNARLFQAVQRHNKELEQRVEERTAALNLEMETRARTEAALHQSQKMESVGQLTGGIAHDFNNMLTGIMGAINLIRRRINLGQLDDLDRFMDAALDSAQRAANLTQRLLAFSRRQSLDSRPIDVNGLLGSLKDLLRRSMRENVRIDFDLNDELMPAIADSNQLESAILNLAINSRDAMPEGGTLSITTWRADFTLPKEAEKVDVVPGRYVAITVSDTGEGIPKEIQDKVFEPFFTTKAIGQGTGLGLSMVYGFAKQSRGQVRIESASGKGTRMTIYLPESEGDFKAQSPREKNEMPGASAAQQVLLVEDDDAVRLLVTEVLSDLGYGAIEAAEPQAAVEILASNRSIDLMVSDVGLPGMNGRQLAEIARHHRPKLPILFITGYAENAAIRSNFIGTNMAMVMKPFEFEVLAEKISEMLGAARKDTKVAQPSRGRGV